MIMNTLQAHMIYRFSGGGGGGDWGVGGATGMKNRYGLASVTGSSAGLTGKWTELNDLPSQLKTK